MFKIRRTNIMYEVRVTPINDESKLVGLATLVVDGKFAFSGIKLLATENPDANSGRGYNVVMPSYKNKNGEYIDFFMPVTKQMHDELTFAIQKSLVSGDVVSFGAPKSFETVRVSEMNNKTNGICATATLAFNKEFVCPTIQVRENKDGEMFVAYPSYKTNQLDKNGKPEYKNVCNPITKECKNELDEKILDKVPVKSVKKDSHKSTYEPSKARRYSSERKL